MKNPFWLLSSDILDIELICTVVRSSQRSLRSDVIQILPIRYSSGMHIFESKPFSNVPHAANVLALSPDEDTGLMTSNDSSRNGNKGSQMLSRRDARRLAGDPGLPQYFMA